MTFVQYLITFTLFLFPVFLLSRITIVGIVSFVKSLRPRVELVAQPQFDMLVKKVVFLTSFKMTLVFWVINIIIISAVSYTFEWNPIIYVILNWASLGVTSWLTFRGLPLCLKLLDELEDDHKKWVNTHNQMLEARRELELLQDQQIKQLVDRRVV